MANRNHHAFFLACTLPMIAALYSLSRGDADRNRLLRFLALGAALSVLALLVLAGSRGGLALGVVGIASSWLIFRAPQAIRRRRAVKKFALPDKVLWLGLGLLAVVASLTTTRTTAINRLLNGDTTSEARFQLLPVFADMIRDYFPFGGGAGSFVRLFQLYEPDWFLGPNYLNHAHNDYAELLIEHGLAGAIAIAAALLLAVRAGITLWQRRKAGFANQRQILGECGMAIVLMLLLGSAADYPLRVPSLQVFFALAVIWVGNAIIEPSIGGSGHEASGSVGDPLLWANSAKGNDT
jgi:O-antigen ligase